MRQWLPPPRALFWLRVEQVRREKSGEKEIGRIRGEHGELGNERESRAGIDGNNY